MPPISLRSSQVDKGKRQIYTGLNGLYRIERIIK